MQWCEVLAQRCHAATSVDLRGVVLSYRSGRWDDGRLTPCATERAGKKRRVHAVAQEVQV